MASGCGIPFWDDKNMVKFIVVMVAQLHKHTETTPFVHSK